MRKSDIFESFAKIAEEKGLLSSDSKPVEKAPITRNAGTLTADEIAKLYGIKPDSSIKYDKNIMEAAHPDPVVISPSYDKLNGLVENNMERQNIILNILDDAPRGDGTVRKLAEKDLVLSLVRIANDLDNSDHQELRALADACLEQTCKKKDLKKVAIGPLAIVALVAVALGGIYAHQHLPNISEGFKANHRTLLSEVDDLLQSESTWYGTGSNFDASLKNDLTKLKDYLTKFYGLYSQVEPLINDFQKPRDAQELMEVAQNGNVEQLGKGLDALRNAAKNMYDFIRQIKINFSSTSYKEQHTEEKSPLRWLLDKTHLSGGDKSLFADQFQDVVNAINPYLESIAEVLNVFNNAKTLQDKAAADLKAAATEKEALFDKKPQAEKPAENKPAASEKTPEEDIDELEKALSGGLQ